MKTKKAYTKPSYDTVSIHTKGMMAQSLTMGTSSTATDVDLTREKKSGGIGGGLWSDMN